MSGLPGMQAGQAITMADDLVLIPLPPLGTLELPRSVFERHLRRPDPVAPPVAVGDAVDLLTADEAARRFSIPKSWLLEKARQSAIPHRRIGRYVRFSPSELSDYLRKSIAVRSIGRS
jgi:excisionase family DNA binding protein